MHEGHQCSDQLLFLPSVDAPAPGLMRGKVARSTGLRLVLFGRNLNLVNSASIDV